jgi:hypothetical protein
LTFIARVPAGSAPSARPWLDCSIGSAGTGWADEDQPKVLAKELAPWSRCPTCIRPFPGSFTKHRCAERIRTPFARAFAQIISGHESTERISDFALPLQDLQKLSVERQSQLFLEASYVHPCSPTLDRPERGVGSSSNGDVLSTVAARGPTGRSQEGARPPPPPRPRSSTAFVQVYSFVP